jgi:hypothetical protein
LRKIGKDSEEVTDRVASAVVVVGILGSPFYNTDLVRLQLLGNTVTPPHAMLTVLCVGLALASRSVLRREFAWADPAHLTWSDYDDSRPQVLTRRLLAGWAARFAATAYLFASSALLMRSSPSLLPLSGALFAGVALFSLAAARRRRGHVPEWAEQVPPLVLAGAGLVTLLNGPALTVLWTLAVLAWAGALVLVLASGVSLAADAGRTELVGRFVGRMIRRTSVAFLDVWALLPQGRAVRWRTVLNGRFAPGRFLLAGVLARGRSGVLMLLLAFVVAALHQVFPAAPSVWWVGIGGYLAILPLATPLAQLYRLPALRRWLNCSDRVLKLTAAGGLVVVTAAWFGVLLLLGVPWSAGAALGVVVAVIAAIRTVTRTAIDFGRLGMITYEGVLIPFGLIAQLVRGPELLLIGLAVLAAGMTLAVAVPVVLMLSALVTLT